MLQEAGLVIVQLNYRIRHGEIDVIALDGDTLVFVEVRLRSRADYGGPAASITARKRRRIVIAARAYLSRDPARACRFDVVLLDAATGPLEWIRGAFTA